MKKSDVEINKWLANWLKTEFKEQIPNAIAPEIENYGIDDIEFSAVTYFGDISGKEMEVKSLKGGYQFKYQNEWNNYFQIDNPNGIKKRLKFGNVPPSNMKINDVEYFWQPDDLNPTDEDMPEELKGKHVYILNAEDLNHNISNSKAYKIYNSKACLAYIAPDGVILYNPKSFRESILGYVWFRVNSHTEEINKKYNPSWELKIIVDLEKGKYIKINPPKELFKK